MTVLDSSLGASSLRCWSSSSRDLELLLSLGGDLDDSPERDLLSPDLDLDLVLDLDLDLALTLLDLLDLPESVSDRDLTSLFLLNLTLRSSGGSVPSGTSPFSSG